MPRRSGPRRAPASWQRAQVTVAGERGQRAREAEVEELRDHLVALSVVLLLGDQHGDAGALRVVIHMRDVEYVGADNARDILEDLGQPLRVVGIVNVFDVFLAMLAVSREADVIDVETERLGKVVEPLQLQALQWPG